jgi:hypothetical protein
MFSMTQGFIIQIETNHRRIIFVPSRQRERVRLKQCGSDRPNVSGTVGAIGSWSFIEPKTIGLLAATAIVGMVIENDAQSDHARIIDDFVEHLDAGQPFQFGIQRVIDLSSGGRLLQQQITPRDTNGVEPVGNNRVHCLFVIDRIETAER